MTTRYAVSIISFFVLMGCRVGPDYVRPDVPLAPTFKELKGWKQATPRDEEDKGPWWEDYDDPTLNQLMGKVNINNQNIHGAEALYRQALALVDSARAGLFPDLGANAGQKRSLNASPTTNPLTVNQSVNTGLNASWALDLWGQIRRTIEANAAGSEANMADLEGVRLAARTTLAQTYFQLRIVDMQKRLYDDTVRAYQKSLEITRHQYKAGIVQKIDVVQAQTLLESTQALATDMGVTRAILEHALAVLVGESPSAFSLPCQPLKVKLPPIPVGVPTELLERRPDIAGAERRMAAANAKIGVAQAAFFPSITIAASGGYQSAVLPGLLSMPNRFWSLGPGLAMPLFDRGARWAATDQAIAVYDQAVATYRQTVLAAFQNVEDQLVTLRLLEDEVKAQERAVASAREVVTKTLHQYQAGTVSTLNVITAQAAALAQERTLMSLSSRRLTAHVGLIAALGGGGTRQRSDD